MKNKAYRLGKYPHNMVIDVFGKDSEHAEESIVIYIELLKRKYPHTWAKYAKVLKYYYQEGLTLVDIGLEMEYSRERVRQLLAKNKRMFQAVSSTLFPEEIPVETSTKESLKSQMSTRTSNILFRHGVTTKDDILNMSPDILVNIRGIGRWAIDDIMQYVGQEYFNKWWPHLANKVNCAEITDLEMYHMCKSYNDT